LHPAEGVPLGIGYRRKGSKTSDGATRCSKEFYDIFIRLDTNTRSSVTDGQMDIFQRQRPRYALRRAGNKPQTFMTYVHTISSRIILTTDILPLEQNFSHTSVQIWYS